MNTEAVKKIPVFSELKDRTFYKSTFVIMIPILMQQMITIGINFFDNIMVGSFGEAQIGAASFGNQFYSLFQFICMGLGSGAIVLTSQFWGAKNREPMKKAAAIALRFTLLLSAVFTVLGAFFPSKVLGFFTNQQAVIDNGIIYLQLISLTFIMSGISSSMTYLLRSTGHTKVPLISSIIAFGLNIYFNWVFIFGVFGNKPLEIVGAAVGTLIARAVEFLIIAIYFLCKDRNFGFRFRHLFMPCKDLFGKYIKYSLPVLISDTMLGFGVTLTAVIIGHVSQTMVASNSIVATAYQMVTIFNTSIAGTACVVIGNTVGTGDRGKSYRRGAAYCVLGVLIGIVATIVLIFVQRPYIALYDISQATVNTTLQMFLVTIIMSPVQALTMVTSKGILRGGGDTRFMMVADVILLWAVSIPLGALSGLVWHLSPFWVYFFLRLEFPSKGIICFIRFLTKKWIKVIQEEVVSNKL